jgi:phage terminase large subunit-like protein
MNAIEIFNQYVADVRGGVIPASKFVKQAVERHVRDVKAAEARGLLFDESAVEHVAEFFGLLRHSKGVHAGKPFTLVPWQIFLLGSVFGWRNLATGRRRFRTAYAEICRKNGKSSVAAGAALYALVADDEPGAEIYALATKKEQAEIVFGEAERMVRASPALRKRIKLLRGEMKIEESNSVFKPLGRDQDSLDGLNIHFAVIDELHAIKHRELVEVIDTATGARAQPLLFLITTAGTRRDGICYEQRQYCEKILSGMVEDDSVFAFIACMDESEDIFDEALWVKANPNLGVSCNVEQLRITARKAKETPTARSAFARYHCGQWVETVNRWLSPDVWTECRADFTAADLEGLECWGGLDLAGTRDLSSLVLLFPHREGCRVLNYNWAPREGALQRQRDDGQPYLNWGERGFITLTDSAVTDQNKIFADIEQLTTRFKIRQIVFDRFNASKLENDIKRLDIEPVALPMTFTGMSLPTKDTEALVTSKALQHDGNPVLAWAISNVCTDEDVNGNIRPVKNKSLERIDPAMALILAVSGWKYGGSEVASWDGEVTFV